MEGQQQVVGQGSRSFSNEIHVAKAKHVAEVAHAEKGRGEGMNVKQRERKLVLLCASQAMVKREKRQAQRTNYVGNTRHPAVIIHGHSVKGFEQVVRYENANKTSGWILMPKRQNAIWCQPESAMFCAHLSHFGMLYICYEEGIFLQDM